MKFRSNKPWLEPNLCFLLFLPFYFHWSRCTKSPFCLRNPQNFSLSVGMNSFITWPHFRIPWSKLYRILMFACIMSKPCLPVCLLLLMKKKQCLFWTRKFFGRDRQIIYIIMIKCFFFVNLSFSLSNSGPDVFFLAWQGLC